jgi:hypothetical protein
LFFLKTTFPFGCFFNSNQRGFLAFPVPSRCCLLKQPFGFSPAPCFATQRGGELFHASCFTPVENPKGREAKNQPKGGRCFTLLVSRFFPSEQASKKRKTPFK